MDWVSGDYECVLAKVFKFWLVMFNAAIVVMKIWHNSYSLPPKNSYYIIASFSQCCINEFDLFANKNICMIIQSKVWVQKIFVMLVNHWSGLMHCCADVFADWQDCIISDNCKYCDHIVLRRWYLRCVQIDKCALFQIIV